MTPSLFRPRGGRATEPIQMTQGPSGTWQPQGFDVGGSAPPAARQPATGPSGAPTGQQPGGAGFYQQPQTFGAGQPQLTAGGQAPARVQQPISAPQGQITTREQAQAWTNQVYNAVLGRAPTKQESDMWEVGLLNNGWTPSQMLTGVQGFPEALPTQPTMTAPTYTPGAIPDIQWGPSAQSSLTQMTQGMTPQQVQSGYQFGGFQLDPKISGMSAEAVQAILENPYSLDDRTIEMLKAKSREEELALSEQRQGQLARAGQRLGITESPWLAGQSAEERRARDESLIGINREIDLEAAERRAAEREAAARLGMGWLDSETARQATAEGFRQQAGAMDLQAQMANQQNIFNYDNLRTNAAVQGAQIDISRALASNDRIQLRETVAQEAARLGQNADKMMFDFLTAQMNDLTQRYGIDVSSYIDLAQLKQQDQQFKEDLAFRLNALEQQMKLSYAQLEENRRQFGVGSSLDLAALNAQNQQFYDQLQASLFRGAA